MKSLQRTTENAYSELYKGGSRLPIRNVEIGDATWSVRSRDSPNQSECNCLEPKTMESDAVLLTSLSQGAFLQVLSRFP